MTDARTEIIMLRPPGGGTTLELSSFSRPDHLPGSPAAPANELGLRNVAFEVHDLHAAVDHAAANGYGLVGGISEYEGMWRMAYVRGPEGIIVSLAERIEKQETSRTAKSTPAEIAPCVSVCPMANSGQVKSQPSRAWTSWRLPEPPDTTSTPTLPGEAASTRQCAPARTGGRAAPVTTHPRAP